MKKAIDKGLVSVNGSVSTTGTFLKGGEVITLSSEENKKQNPIVKLPLEICFENDHLAIINKPAGVLVSGNKKKTIANALAYNLTKSTTKDALERPKPVHRLDFPTTGLLLIAKTHQAIIALGNLFKKRLITKTYYAVAYGKMEKEGVIKTSIDSKTAFTKYEVVQSVSSEKFQYLNLVKLAPKTGRKHQLRIHLSEIGNPILGDKKYGKNEFSTAGKGLYLHASSLEFIDPMTEESILVTKELPKKFKKIFPQ